MNYLILIIFLLMVYYIFKKIIPVVPVVVILIIFCLLTRNTSGFGKGVKIIESVEESTSDSNTGDQIETKINEEDITSDTVLIFYAKWCGHCKNSMPEFKKAVGQGKGKVILVDSDKNRDLVDKYKVKGFPTIIKGDKTEYKEKSRNAESIIKFLQS